MLSVGAILPAVADYQGFKNNDLPAAKQLLIAGDAAYEKEDYKAATEAFGKALSFAPPGGGNKTINAALKQRYAQAAVEHARARIKLGDYPTATSLLETVLADNMLPGYLDALTLQSQLLDPIRTNPALTLEHTQDIQQVAFGLRKGHGAIDLGRFDEAKSYFEGVLKIDPQNRAARRGMERALLERGKYYDSAYDQTRAKLLSQVDAGWEQLQELNTIETGRLDVDENLVIDQSSQPIFVLKEIILPSLVLEDVTLDDAINFLTAQAIELDTRAIPANEKGINFVIEGGSEVLNRTLSLRLQNVPMEAALNFITSKVNAKWAATDFAIRITDKDVDIDTLISRSWIVPPDFISRGSMGAEEDLDPFGGDDSGSGPRLLTKTLTAREFLEGKGISFPDGASVSYSPGTGVVRMKNTPANIDIADQIIQLIIQEEPVSLIVRARIIQVSEETLNELGYETLIGGNINNSAGNVFLSGGTIPGQANPTNGISPISGGLRSGTQAIVDTGIESLLTAGESGFGASSTPAPGILSASYVDNASVGLLLRGLQQKKGFDIAASPSVVTRPGQRAVFRQIREFIYPTEYEPPEIPTSTGGGLGNNGLGVGVGLGLSQGITPITPSTPTAFEMREVGVVLEAEGTISADRNYINLTIVPSITEFEGFVNYGTPITGSSTTNTFGAFNFLNPNFLFNPITSSTVSGVITDNQILQPVFSVVKANTSLTIANGGTVAIGGLLSSRSQPVEDSVPILGDLPLIGRFFQSEAERTTRQAVVILVSAEAVDPTGRRVGSQ